MEKRQSKRVHLFQRVQVSDGEHETETFCLDISMKGILLVHPENIHWGEGQALTVNLSVGDGADIVMETSLVHMDGEVVGCSCEYMDVESQHHLREVLEDGLEVPTQINRELEELRAEVE